MLGFFGTPFVFRVLLCALAACVTTLSARLSRFSPPGSLARLAAALPAALLLFGARLLFLPRESVALTLIVGLCSLVAFKCLAFAVGRGPLVEVAESPATIFLAWAILPVMPPSRREWLEGGHPLTPKHLAFSALWQALAAPAVFLLSDASLVPLLSTFLRGTAMSLSLGAFWDFSRLLAALPPLRLRTGRGFEAPWLAGSVGELWGRRWNVVAGRVVAALARDPIIDGTLVPPFVVDGRPSCGGYPPHRAIPTWRRLLGLQSAFLATGLWHAVVLYPAAAGGFRGGWRWFLFFSLQAPMVAFERVWVALGLPVPSRPVRTVLTGAAVSALARPLFFEAYEAGGTMQRVRELAGSLLRSGVRGSAG
ncbi:hypothetical protein DFJ74DRAFT_122190 [Hyaloraphidium curvatum]|nr:hypothetical protein DFJ74DRAFT_122190 [Hyaloraphidium curvatum]